MYIYIYSIHIRYSIYTICECIYTNNDDCDDIYKYDTDTDTWTYVSDRASGLNAQYGGVVYDSESDLGIFIEMGDVSACGGYDCDDIWAYDYNSDTWTKKMDMDGDISGQGASLFYDSQSDIIVLRAFLCKRATNYRMNSDVNQSTVL